MRTPRTPPVFRVTASIPAPQLRAAALAMLRGPRFRQYLIAGVDATARACGITPPASLELLPATTLPEVRFRSGRFFALDYTYPGAHSEGEPIRATVVVTEEEVYLTARDLETAHAALRQITATTSAAVPQALRPGAIVSSASAKTYAAHVRHVREAILAGDLFQANLSREIAVELPGATRADVTGFAERLLDDVEPPFGAIVQRARETIISASPERFFRVDRLPDGRLKVIAEPIKGTRPRHADTKLDRAAAAELLASEKDRAENVMIADLVRNDLSRVCEDDSVTVERLCELRSFASVHHLVTTVTGILLPGLTAIDALHAQFPCGSITGAPKLAAMDLIAELEQRERGIYCGAIGYVDDDGTADFSVAIRTATVTYHDRGATLRYGVGGGVTTLSDPAEEYRETEDKAADFLKALRV